MDILTRNEVTASEVSPAKSGSTERTVKTERFSIGGMTCAACQARVQRRLGQEPGVVSASVNLLLKSADVIFDPSITSARHLIEAVRSTGYEAEVMRTGQTAAEEQDARDRAQAAEYAAVRSKAVVSGLAGLLAMVLSMPLMGGTGERHLPATDPFMRWSMEWLTPAVRAMVPWLFDAKLAVLSWGLLSLTLGVMGWAGRHFDSRAWSAFRHHSADMNTLVAVGTGAAFLYSALATLAPGVFVAQGIAPEVYYEAVILIIALILTGHALEARAKRQTADALRALVSLQPKLARVVRDNQEQEVPV